MELGGSRGQCAPQYVGVCRGSSRQVDEHVPSACRPGARGRRLAELAAANACQRVSAGQSVVLSARPVCSISKLSFCQAFWNGSLAARVLVFVGCRLFMAMMLFAVAHVAFYFILALRSSPG